MSRTERQYSQPSETASQQISRLDSIRKLKIETDKLKLMQKLKIEEEVSLQKSVLKMLNNQIEQQKQMQKMEIQQKIIQRLEQNKGHYDLREKMRARSNKEIQKLKILKQLHDIENEEKIKYNNLERNIEEAKILSQKKKLLDPIKFEEIREHEQQYLLKKTSERKATVRSLPKLTNYRPSNSKVSEVVKKQLDDAKHSFVNRRNHLAEQIARRVAYGIEAQKLHKYEKIKTEPSKYEIMDKELNKQKNQKIQKELRKVRKQKIKFVEGDVVEITKKQISAIKESDMSFNEKFDILNNLSRGYIEKFDNGKEYCVELAASANIALADLYLSQQSN